MTDPRRGFEGEDEQTRDLAPENENAEQDDEDAQAQTLANEAVGRSPDDFGLGDTQKDEDNSDFADTQDLVDHMNQMVSSGRIDMSAFRGEPNFDDEEGLLGPGGEDEADEEDYE
jgi:hypothetical protein